MSEKTCRTCLKLEKELEAAKEVVAWDAKKIEELCKKVKSADDFINARAEYIERLEADLIQKERALTDKKLDEEEWAKLCDEITTGKDEVIDNRDARIKLLEDALRDWLKVWCNPSTDEVDLPVLSCKTRALLANKGSNEQEKTAEVCDGVGGPAYQVDKRFDHSGDEE